MPGVAANLQAVRDRIDAAARRSGRTGDDITLIVVTKTRGIDDIEEALSCGVMDIGENYVQEAEEKFSSIGGAVKWHMIGHLQRNKARHAVEVFSMIHSVDSVELAREIGRRADSAGKVMDVLIEVRVSGEETKFGVEPGRALALAEDISQLEGIRLCGLMGMAPFMENPADTRPYFTELKRLWDRLPDGQRIFLSMGMTQDFEIAIEEGSNMVRIGTAIFGPRQGVNNHGG